MNASMLFECHRFGSSETILSADELTREHKFLILHGGEDISPSYYGEVPIKTSAKSVPSLRDKLEVEALKRAWELDIPVLAICRGAQLACAIQGGGMFQDVPGHVGEDHILVIPEENNRIIMTNTCHHQMMIPKDGHVLAHGGKVNRRRFKGKEYVVETMEEPEVVYWKDTRTLGVQGHPEWDHSRNSIYDYTKSLMFKLFGVEYV